MKCHSDEKQQKLEGHAQFFRLEAPTIARVLPWRSSDVPLKVFVTCTNAEVVNMKALKEYVVSPDNVREVFAMFKQYGNELYDGVELDESNLSEYDGPDNVHRFIVFEDEKSTSSDLDPSNGPGVGANDDVDSSIVDNDVVVDGSVPSDDASFIETVICDDVGCDDDVAVDQEFVDSMLLPGGDVISGSEYRSRLTCSISPVYGKNSFLIHGGNSLLGSEDDDYFYHLFPHLFPHARGGPNEVRSVPISLEVYVEHLLRLSHGRFQCSEFVLIAYDIISRKRMVESARIRVAFNPNIYVDRVTANDLRTAASYQDAIDLASRLGRPRPVAPENYSSESAEMLRSITSTTQAAPHSRSATEKNRKLMFSMSNVFGKGDVWLTLNPSDSHNKNVYRMARGGSVPNLCPARSERMKVIVKFSGAAAINFERTLDIFIDRVIGWDTQKKMPYACGGLFGVAKAFELCVEEQARLSLHTHVVIWLVGHSSIGSRLSKCAKSSVDQSAFDSSSISVLYRSVIDDMVSTDILGDDISLICSSCGGSEYDPVVESEVVRLRKRHVDEDVCLVCSGCGEEHVERASEAVSTVLDDALTSVGVVSGDIPVTVDDLQWMMQGMPVSSEEFKTVKRRVLAHSQTHSHKHAASCWKKGDGRCRYRLPDVSHSISSVAVPSLGPVSVVPSVSEVSNAVMHVDSEFVSSLLDDDSVMVVSNSQVCGVIDPLDVESVQYDLLADENVLGPDDDGFVCTDPDDDVFLSSFIHDAGGSQSVSDIGADVDNDYETDDDAFVSTNPADASFVSSLSPDVRAEVGVDDAQFVSSFWPGEGSSGAGEADGGDLPSDPDVAIAEILISMLVDGSARDENEDASILESMLADAPSDIVSDLFIPPMLSGDSAVTVALKRKPQDAYVSPFNTSLTDIFAPANVNVKPVQSCLLAFYLAAYASKVNKEMDGRMRHTVSKVIRYLERRQNAGSAVSAFGMLLSGVYAHTSTEAIGSQLASYLLLRHSQFSRFVYSHSFSSLSLSSIVRELEGATVMGTVVGDRVRSPCALYLGRPSALDCVSLYGFISEYEVISAANVRRRDELLDDIADVDHGGYFEFDYIPRGKDLPVFPAKVARRRDINAVPMVYGPRLPNYHTLYVDDEHAVTSMNGPERELLLTRRELYARTLVILFVNFRVPSDIVPSGDETWWNVYLRFRPRLFSDDSARMYITHQQLFYTAFTRAKKIISFGSDGVVGEPDADVDIDLSVGAVDGGVMDVSRIMQNSNLVRSLSAAGVPPTIPVEDVESLDLSYLTSVDVGTFFKKCTASGGDDGGGVDVDGGISGDDSGDVDVDNGSDGDDSSGPPRVGRTRIISLVGRAVDDIVFLGDQHGGDDTSTFVDDRGISYEGSFPTIAEQSRRYGLNEKQHHSFVVMALCLLDRVTMRNSESHEESTARRAIKAITGGEDQVFMHVSGSGGVGKSWVISCFSDFASRWESSSVVRIFSTSGISASHIGGNTIDSGIYQGLSPKIRSVTDKQLEEWQMVGVVLLDEVSMLTSPKLVLMCVKLAMLKGCSATTHPFGGLHIITVGDFFQIPAIGERLPFAPASSILSSGQLLWRDRLNVVVFLDQCVRHENDSDFRDVCARLRVNAPLACDMSLLNTRLVTIDNAPPMEASLVTFKNDDRRAYNMKATLSFFAGKGVREGSFWRSAGGIRVVAEYSASNGFAIPDHSLSVIRALAPKRSKWKIEDCLDLIIGGPYMVTQNLCVKHGICNGSPVILVDVILHKDAVVSYGNVASVEGASKIPCVSAGEVKCVVLKHRSGFDSDTTFSPRLPAGHFPLFFDKKYSSSFKVKFNYDTVMVKVVQLPMVMAAAMTVHKSQGSTIEPLLTGDVSDKNKYGRDGILYVMLSRCTSLSRLYISSCFTTNVTKFKPRKKIPEFVQWMKDEIEVRTLSRLESVMEDEDDDVIAAQFVL